MNLPGPPSGITGPLKDYLDTLRKALNTLPTYSYASIANPNSFMTGIKGDRYINLGSASTLSREWVKVGPDNNTASTTSWVLMRILG
jgi:hypothetical protein